jgi:hypothetical protein
MKLLLPRRRFLLGGAALICAPAIIPARAQLTLTGAGKGAVGGGGGGTTTFDSVNIGTGLSLDATKLIVSSIGSSPHAIARSLTSHSTGKFYAEFTAVGFDLSGYDAGFTIVSGSQGLNALVGQSGNTTSAQVDTADPAVYINGSSVGNTGVTVGSGDTLGVALDLGGKLLWVRKNGGNWNGNALYAPDGLGGVDISTLTGAPFYLAIYNINPSNTYTGNFGGSAYGTAAPAGYGNY